MKDGLCEKCGKPFWTCDHPIEAPEEIEQAEESK